MKGVDTTFLIRLLRKDSGAVIKAIELDKEPIVFTTEANVYELVSGIKKGIDAEEAVCDLENLLSRLTILPLDHKSSIKSGLLSRELLQKGKMIDDIDCLVAGTLLANGCETIITRNVKHFERIHELKIESY